MREEYIEPISLEKFTQIGHLQQCFEKPVVVTLRSISCPCMKQKTFFIKQLIQATTQGWLKLFCWDETNMLGNKS